MPTIIDDPTPADRRPPPKAMVVNDRLCREYTAPIPYFHDLDPLSELVSSLALAPDPQRRLRSGVQGAASRFPDWGRPRRPDRRRRGRHPPCTWPEQKAPRSRRSWGRSGSVAAAIPRLPRRDDRTRRARLARSVARRRAEDERGHALFSGLRRPALPVDSHHHRVAERLGLIPANVAVGPAHALLEAQLPPDWTAQQVYDNHETLMLHGQKVCLPDEAALRGMRGAGSLQVRSRPDGTVVMGWLSYRPLSEP